MRKIFTLFAVLFTALLANAQDEPTMLWEKEGTYSAIPDSWGEGWSPVFENDYIKVGTPIKIQKWSNNTIVILNWFNTSNSEYDGYSDVTIGHNGNTITSIGGNAQSEWSSYFYTGHPGEIDYAYVFNSGTDMNYYNFIETTKKNCYVYFNYCIYNNSAWGSYMTYFVTWTDEDAASSINNIDSASENIAAYNLMGQKVAPNTKGIVIKNGVKTFNR